jgi:hypothetical protein
MSSFVSVIGVCVGLPSEIPTPNSSILHVIYTQKRYCKRPCRQVQQHICYGDETGIFQQFGL